MRVPRFDALRLLALLPLLAAACLTVTAPARAAEVTWTGAFNTDWSNPANWDPGAPGPEDTVRIPDVANQPEIAVVDAVCAGIVLEEGATVRVLDSGFPTAPFALYIIGPGDLDGDGVPDVVERDESLGVSDFDADGDGVPNIAEADSDSDSVGDSCEFTYKDHVCEQNGSAQFHPYLYDDPNLDCDLDGHTNGEECAAGSDPTDPNSDPDAMSLLGNPGMVALVLTLLAISVQMLRKAGPRTRRMLSVLLAVSLLALGGYVGTQPLLAASLSVDFALGQTVEGVASTATAGDTLEVDGASVRPWNGRSTYLNKSLTLLAKDGAVFLGGMRSTLKAGVLGQGTLGVARDYTGPDQLSPVSEIVHAGTAELEIYLGERFTLTQTPEIGWGFHGWTGDATGTTSPLSFQALADGPLLTAVFGPPGPDLAATLDTGPSSPLYAGDTVSVEILIENIGQSDTLESSWGDGLYLSRDDNFDEMDLAMDVNAHAGAVVADDDYTASFSATLPDVAPGNYYVLGVADAGHEATDENRNNNVVSVRVTVLDFNLAQ